LRPPMVGMDRRGRDLSIGGFMTRFVTVEVGVHFTCRDS